MERQNNIHKYLEPKKKCLYFGHFTTSDLLSRSTNVIENDTFENRKLLPNFKFLTKINSFTYSFILTTF